MDRSIRLTAGRLLAGLLFVAGTASAAGNATEQASAQPSAQPLADLSARLAAWSSDAPLRVEVEVEQKHRGSAPLHLRRTKQVGGAVIEWGPRGVESLEQWWFGAGARVTIWERAQRRPVIDEDDRVLSDQEASELADPAGTLGVLLQGATLLADEPSTWDGRAARRLTIRPATLNANERAPEREGPDPLELRLAVWLDEAGEPLAVERSVDFAAGPFSAQQRQTLVLGQVDGRLVVSEMRETWTGQAVALLRGQDDKRVVLRSAEGRVPRGAG
jgi:hypothetical protein